MISYNKIGHFGRLGNQMFQFASTVGVANKTGHDVAFPKAVSYTHLTLPTNREV